MKDSTLPPIQGMNILGVWTLYQKEVRRFIKVYNQTLFAPMITALLFLAIFSLALGERVKIVGTIPFAEFMAAGLVMMSLVQNAFANGSSAFIMGKVMGTILDYMLPPFRPHEIMIAMVMGGITRGIMVGTLVAIAISFFVPLSVHSVLWSLFYMFSASMMLALLGMLAGILGETFDHVSAITSYVITPLAFLSGTFYSVHNLPEFWYHVSQYNPFFYMIDGFRYGLTGYHDGDLMVGVGVMVGCNALLWFAVYKMLKVGYKMRS